MIPGVSWVPGTGGSILPAQWQRGEAQPSVTITTGTGGAFQPPALQH